MGTSPYDPVLVSVLLIPRVGNACSGTGWCKNMYSWAAAVGLTYGEAYGSNIRDYPGESVVVAEHYPTPT